jgi:hypothetical protein
VAEWLGPTARPPSEITSWSDVKPQPEARPKPEVKPQPEVRPLAGGKPPVTGPSSGGTGRPGARRAARLAAAALVIAVLAVTAVRFLGHPAGGPADPATRRAQAAARGAAATWVARQVSRDVKVSCDPVMCAALKARGFPPGEMLVLESTSEVPTGSAVVVETPAVLSLFGSSLATAWAPAVLASFGSGPALVTVRVVAASGAAAYQARLGADLADRKKAGAALLDDPQISVTPLASGQLTAGEVDPRLLLALAALAGHEPISIVRFGNPGRGASPGVPLRYADLTERDRSGRLPSAGYVRAVRADLSTLTVMLRPASMTTGKLADDQAVLRIGFTAPSPLGLLGPQASS